MEGRPSDVGAALREEREFVLTLGGYALEVAGATLVTHERIPVPRFNFVQDVRVGEERQAAFFERALDHYFQRSLRPSFRLPQPVAPHLDVGLRRLGFVPAVDPRTLFLRVPSDAPPDAARGTYDVRVADTSDIDALVPFWTGDREGEEFRRALEIVWHHPNPGERMAPLVARRQGRAVAAALLYTFDHVRGIHAVATQPDARGLGAASALVDYAVRESTDARVTTLAIESEWIRLDRRLAELGFRAAGRWTSYELPPDAQLALPDPGAPQPPRWRPPRKPG